MIVNVTINGHSANICEIDQAASDEDIRAAAYEIIGGGEVPNMTVRPGAFDNYVVDRFETTFYLRPKVPFG